MSAPSTPARSSLPDLPQPFESDSPSAFTGRKGMVSARSLVRRNGDVYAIPHPVHAAPVETPKRPFTASTYRQSFSLPQRHGAPKLLTPYHWNAPRSRPHIVFPKARPSNESTIKFTSGGNHTDSRRFVSTQRSHYLGQTGQLPVGFGNPGIASATTRWMHSRSEL